MKETEAGVTTSHVPFSDSDRVFVVIVYGNYGG